MKIKQASIFLLVGFAMVARAENVKPITKETVAEAQKIIGLNFSDEKLEMLPEGLISRLDTYKALRDVDIPFSTFPAVLFNPLPAGFRLPTERKEPKWSLPSKHIKRPANLEEVAFWSIPELAALIKSRQVSAEELTKMYLGRLKKYGPKLECVVTLTEDLALEQAREADREIAAGKYRGLLHGIPYGAKDLLDTKGIRTTWGAAPFTNRIPDGDATVVKKLRDAGAILVAKTTMGELAWGNVWFGGETRNPWNVKTGSSGSSAGSSAGVSAGLFPFAIGSETHGSIISPGATCGVTGLRPTYGRISRAGCMSLSWTMDKLGPICRNAEDCAVVLDAIYGPDGMDQTVYDVPFNYSAKVNLKKLRIGFLKSDFEKEKSPQSAATLEKLRSMGVDLIPLELPKKYPVGALSFVLSTEGAAFFDDMTRDSRDDLLKRQKNGWPPVFRNRRFVPAVEYLRAQQIRTLVIQEVAKFMENVDVYLAPWDTGDNLLLNNLTGHPGVVVPNGFDAKGMPTAITFVGKLFDEAELLAVAKAYQDATDFHLQHPKLTE